ncbi:MAG TPA: MmcQ/YjbR family DNA-binding protein [Acidimicrobiales bacterium]|nr:MmcQ/YjbR family DNA-binding protein [Acidimicrobiales bacterium]
MAEVSADRLKGRLASLCERLPEAQAESSGPDSRHVRYRVRNKNFAYFTDDHHGNGRLELHCKAPPGEQEALVGAEPGRFFVPPYLGPRGWVGLWLDVAPVDWDEVADLLTEAYRLTAPKRLAAGLD